MASNKATIGLSSRSGTSYASDCQLTTDDIREVQDRVWDARCKWYEIGIQLQLKVSDLDSIKDTCSGDPNKCIREMLIIWLRNHKATWMVLSNALKHKTVGFPSLARLPISPKVSTLNPDLIPTCTFHPAVAACEILTTAPAKGLQEGFKCLCGNCTVDQFLERRCPNSDSTSDSSFPFLDTKNLTESEKHMLHATLRKETRNIITEFADLLRLMRQSFTECKLDPKEIGAAVLTIAPRESSTLPLLNTLDIKEVNSIGDITSFLLQNNYLSFFNYHIVVYLIENYGTETDNDVLKHYTTKFQQFCQRSVFEVPQNVFGKIPGDGTTLAVKVTKQMVAQLASMQSPETSDDETPSSPILTASSKTLKLSLQDTLVVQEKVAEALSIKQPWLLVFLGASEGCIRLTFSFPRVFMPSIKAHLDASGLPAESGTVTSLSNLEAMGIHILCGAPGRPYATTVTDDSVTIQWTKPEYQGLHGLTHYHVYYRECQETKWEMIVSKCFNEKVEVRELSQRGRSFVFKVQGVNSIGPCVESEKSEPIKLLHHHLNGASVKEKQVSHDM